MTSNKQLRAMIRNHRGDVYADVVFRDDAAPVRVVKADMLALLALPPEDARIDIERVAGKMLMSAGTGAVSTLRAA